MAANPNASGFQDFTLKFHTGPAPLGYAISELDIHFVPPDLTVVNIVDGVEYPEEQYGADATVSVHSASRGIPGSKVFTFRSPAAKGTITLNAADTTSRPGAAGLKVVRAGANLGNEVCFVFETTNGGTATPGVDFHPKLVPVWMQADENERTMWVQAKRDNVDTNADQNETVVAQIRDARYCNIPQNQPTISTATRTWTLVEPPSAQAKFFAPPIHDGKTKFAMQLALSDPARNTRDEMQDHVVQVRGGQLRSVEPVNGQPDLWEVTVDPDGEAPFTAAFEDAPESHDGASAFNAYLRFSEAPAGVKNIHIKGALQITGGKILRVRVVGGVNGDEAHRRVEIEPDGDGDVQLSLPPATDCAAANALCTADGEPLEETATVTVPGPDGEAPLTAAFEDAPESHDGASAFNAYLRFSETPANVKNIHIKGALSITGGRILRVRVVGGVNGDEAHRRVEIEPAGDGDVQLSLPPTTDCAATNALCTADGRPLSQAVSAAIPGPASLTPEVSDAGVDGSSLTLTFSKALDEGSIPGTDAFAVLVSGTARGRSRMSR